MLTILSWVAQARGEACLSDYGNPPRPLTNTLQGRLTEAFAARSACQRRNGEVLTFGDRDGTPRVACLHVPPGASPSSHRPLVVFLGGARSSAMREAYSADFERRALSENLSGDPARPGFIFLAIEGRDTEHYYPAPADRGTGWDTWYRNLDRRDPAVNVDVQVIDRFIAAVRARGIVDRKRRYMMGWSNGAAMALLYGMNTRGIAATAVYSSPDPYADQFDPCPQAPFAKNPRPLMTLHNSCDIFGICATGALDFRMNLMATHPGLPLSTLLINGRQQRVQGCEAACSYEIGRASCRERVS
jgi:poly(3-hydroxybutyrate) depolymerase